MHWFKTLSCCWNVSDTRRHTDDSNLTQNQYKDLLEKCCMLQKKKKKVAFSSRQWPKHKLEFRLETSWQNAVNRQMQTLHWHVFDIEVLKQIFFPKLIQILQRNLASDVNLPVIDRPTSGGIFTLDWRVHWQARLQAASALVQGFEEQRAATCLC